MAFVPEPPPPLSSSSISYGLAGVSISSSIIVVTTPRWRWGVGVGRGDLSIWSRVVRGSFSTCLPHPNGLHSESCPPAPHDHYHELGRRQKDALQQDKSTVRVRTTSSTPLLFCRAEKTRKKQREKRLIIQNVEQEEANRPPTATPPQTSIRSGQ